MKRSYPSGAEKKKKKEEEKKGKKGSGKLCAVAFITLPIDK